MDSLAFSSVNTKDTFSNKTFASNNDQLFTSQLNKQVTKKEEPKKGDAWDMGTNLINLDNIREDDVKPIVGADKRIDTSAIQFLPEISSYGSNRPDLASFGANQSSVNSTTFPSNSQPFVNPITSLYNSSNPSNTLPTTNTNQQTKSNSSNPFPNFQW